VIEKCEVVEVDRVKRVFAGAAATEKEEEKSVRVGRSAQLRRLVIERVEQVKSYCSRA
jgi:hypothetical protein